MKRAFMLSLMFVAAAAFAQEAQTLDMRPKHSAPIDGSLAITQGHGTGFDMTLGGTAVKDRVWFFASAERTQPMFATTVYGQPQALRTIDTKAIANISDRQNLTASFADTKMPLTVPSTFLSLHYTGVITSNSFFTMNLSQTRR